MSTVTMDWPELFLGLRHDKDDARWGARAMMKLLWADLSPVEVDRLLASALDEVRATGQQATELFGDPDDWAAARLVDASAEGATFLDDRSNANDLITVALLTAAVFSLLFGVLPIVKGHWSENFQLGWLLSPLTLSITIVSLVTVRERALRRHSQARALGIAVAVAPVLIAANVGLFATRIHLGRHSTLWWFAEAGLLALLAAGAARFLPDPPRARVRARGTLAVDDEQWIDLARATMRERAELTEEEITRRVDEAREHARLAGSTLSEEFGNPIGYAKALPADPRVRPRRELLLWSFLACIGLGMALGDGWRHPHWWWSVYTLFAISSSVVAWRRYREACRQLGRRG